MGKTNLLVGGNDTAGAAGGVDLSLGAGNGSALSAAGADTRSNLGNGVPVLISHIYRVCVW